jgi:hypothetical protein
MTKSRTPAAVEPDDIEQVPFPEYEPRSDAAARYTLTRMGRVRRIGVLPRLVIPVEREPRGQSTSSGGARGSLIVRLAGGTVTRSLPRAVWEAFGDASRMPNDGQEWVPWLRHDAPEDPETRARRCSVEDVVLVSRGDAQRYAMYGVIPDTQISIV